MQDTPIARLQEICHNTFKRGVATPLEAAFAALGCWGKHASNIVRDLSARMRQDLINFIEPTWVPVLTAEGPSSWPILPPHELMSLMVDHRESELRGGLDMQEFWDQFLRDPWYDNNWKQAARARKLSEVIPLRLHGDEGRFSGKNRGVLVLQLSTFAHSAHAYDSRYLLSVIPSARYFKEKTYNRTLDGLMKFIVWSVGCLEQGIWPQEPYEGTSLSKRGLRMRGRPMKCQFLMVGLKADWKFSQQLLQQKHSFVHHSVCMTCAATKSHDDCPYFDFRPTAAWRDHLLSHAESNALMKSAWLQHPGFNYGFLHDDLMHTVYA